MDLQVKTAAAALWYELDWSQVLPTGIALVSATHQVSDGLTLQDEGCTPESAKSSVKISGGTHGGLYVVRGIGLLSNGDMLPWDFPLRIFG